MALRTLGAEDREEAAEENWSREVDYLDECMEKADARIRHLEHETEKWKSWAREAGEDLEMAQARVRELEAALRGLYVAAQDEAGANGWVTMPSAMNEAHEALAATAPPDSEPAVPEAITELSESLLVRDGAQICGVRSDLDRDSFIAGWVEGQRDAGGELKKAIIESRRNNNA